MLLMFVAIYNLVTEAEQPHTVAFSEFIADVHLGKVERVRIKPREHTAEYHYIHKEGAREACVSIGIISDVLMSDLITYGTRVEYVPEDSGLWGSMLSTWLPALVILGIVFFRRRPD